MAKKQKTPPAAAEAKKKAAAPAEPKRKKGGKPAEPEPPAGPPKPQRGLAIGDNFGWTGKLPATLLFEFCQKQKWNKAAIDMRKVAGGFVGVVDLSWQNPKTREVIHLRWSPDTELLPPRATTNEARHFAATHAMHRINFVKNLRMVLPTSFRDYWTAMETKRLALLAADKRAHDRIYNAQPFQVHLDGVAEKAARAKERESRHNSDAKVRQPTASVAVVAAPRAAAAAARPAPPAARSFAIGRKAWDNAPFVDFPPDVRTALESAVQHHISWAEAGGEAAAGRGAGALAAQLAALGFRTSHAQEALLHTRTFVDALEWLLFHVPEDDLPAFFARRDDDRSVSLTISRDIHAEYVMQRLAVSGHAAADIAAAYAASGRDEHRACVALAHKTVGYTPPPGAAALAADNDDVDTWTQELDGIDMIGSNTVAADGPHKRVATVSLNVANVARGMLSARLFFVAGYPHVLPGVQLVVNDPSFKLANYIKLAVVRQLLAHVLDSGLLGECFLFNVIEWLENNVARVIENPGSLVAPPRERAEQHAPGAGPRARPATRSRTAPVASEAELRAEYAARQKSAAMQRAVAQRQTLPAWRKRDALVDTITRNRVTLVTGETGSGKSTQIVQFVLDHMCAQGNFRGQIVCTQPRRISTIGLAERVSEERTAAVGGETGYVIRGENRTSRHTRLQFVTTGVLLRMLQHGEDAVLARVEYIFVDEVHERSVDSDFLLMLLKRVMRRHPALRLVLMSATIDTDVFVRFFDTPVHHLHIEGRTFPIADHYLDDILEATDFTVETNDGVVRPRADSHFFKTGAINYDLVAQLCVHIDGELARANNAGSILVFLPGIMEITRCLQRVEHAFARQSRRCWGLPLHSGLSSKDQTRVFQKPPQNTRKIVVSTNIAETSITIPDCVAVVDSGRAKSMLFDAAANTSRLVESWCSRAEMAQRRGRSGRIQSGTCYHMYARATEQAAAAQPVPEIRRTRLENLYLVVKAMGVGDVAEFLAGGLDAPERRSLAKARASLAEIGALAVADGAESLTHLGKYLSYVPTDLHAGKLLILGCIFGCVDICLTVAAVCSAGSPFSSSFDIKDEVRAAKTRFGKNQGDLLASAFAFHEWEATAAPQRKKFTTANYLSYLTLQDIQTSRAQYVQILKEIGFLPVSYRRGEDPRFAAHNDNYSLVRAIITGSFTPQVARVQLPDPKYAQTLAGAVELDADAKQTKFWIRNEKYIDQCNAGGAMSELPATRAFVHPSSLVFSSSAAGADLPNIEELAVGDTPVDWTPQSNFSTGAMHKAPFVVYAAASHTSRLFLREITPTSTLGVLLFGGDISYDLSALASAGKRCPGIVLDKWQPIRTWCKNGVLIKRLRRLLDQVIENKLSDPARACSPDDDAILAIVAKIIGVK